MTISIMRLVYNQHIYYFKYQMIKELPYKKLIADEVAISPIVIYS